MQYHQYSLHISSFIIVLCVVIVGCSDDSGAETQGLDGATGLDSVDPQTDGGGDAPTDHTSQGDISFDVPVGVNHPSLAACGGAIFDAAGVLQVGEYVKQARLWTKEAIDCRLGARYEDVHEASEPDTRPDLWEPSTIECGGNGTMSAHEYGEGCSANCSDNNDFGSTAGPVIYAPDDLSDPGIDRVTNYAYDGVQVAVRPQPSTGGSHPEPSLNNTRWPTIGFQDPHPFAVARTHLGWGNQAIALFADGFVGAIGTRTDGVPSENYFGFRFPEHLAPTAVSVSAMNEFVFVTLWDTQTHQGKLAIFAMHGNSPFAHTWWYIGLPNAGGFWAGKLLGYVDLPIATPTSMAVVTNGIRTSPHDTGTQPLAGFTLVDKDGCRSDVMDLFDHGGPYTNVVASHGYVLIASRWEDKVVFVDLEPMLAYYRKAYLEDLAFCNANLPQVYNWDGYLPPTWFDGDDRWPYPFSHPKAAGSAPVVSAMLDIPSPRDVSAGFIKSGGTAKAYALSDDGTLHVLAPNRLYRRRTDNPNDTTPIESGAEPAKMGQIDVCPHATALSWSGKGNNFPSQVSASALGGAVADPAIRVEGRNDLPTIVCRGDRKIQQFVVTGDTEIRSGLVWELTDQAMGDPVAMDYSERGPVMSVADFDGKKLINYQMGNIVGQGCATNNYPVQSDAPEGQLRVNRGGSLALPGSPHAFNSTNIN